jgi:hypothetical protein
MGRGRKENDGGVNSTLIHCKNFCKCHNELPIREKFLKKGKRKEEELIIKRKLNEKMKELVGCNV